MRSASALAAFDIRFTDGDTAPPAALTAGFNGPTFGREAAPDLGATDGTEEWEIEDDGAGAGGAFFSTSFICRKSDDFSCGPVDLS